MGASLKYELKKEPRADGACLIMLRVTYLRRLARLGTGQYVLPANWNPTGSEKRANWVKGKASDAVIINKDLESKYLRAHAVLVRLQQEASDLDVKAIKEAIAAYWNHAAAKKQEVAPEPEAAPHRMTFGELLSLYANTDRQPSRSMSAQVRGAKKNLADSGLLEVPVVDMTRNTAAAIAKQVLDSIGPATAERRMKTLKAAYQHAIDSELISKTANIFDRIRMPKALVVKVRLSREQLNAVISASGLTEHERDARDTFLVQYYSGGARIGDVLRLRWSNVSETMISYFAGKDRKPRDIVIVPPLREILDRFRLRTFKAGIDTWVLPWLEPGLSLDYALKNVKATTGSPTALINKALKSVAAKAGITAKLTTHVARHTYADHHISVHGDIHMLKTQLGHSGVTVTEGYINSLKQPRVDEAHIAVVMGKKKPGET